jgi:hypothetical protein
MSHFAKLDENNVVIFVTVGRQEDDGKEAELSARTGEVYKQTSYNTFAGQHCLGGTPFRKNFAGVGFTYNEQRDAFIPPKPFNSWVLDENTCQWQAPFELPNDSKNYVWNEQSLSWVETLTTGE